VRRREFIKVLGGAAATWPLAAHAPQGERVRRVGALGVLAKDDPEAKAHEAAFQQALAGLGWTVGGNLRIDYRWAAGDATRLRKYKLSWLGLRQTSF
jgi:putative ABC transport system substrate-binding protein